jgi:hypothetical protein
MDANTVSDNRSPSDPNGLEDSCACASCRQRSFLETLVAELLYENQLLRFELSQSQEVVCQVRIVCDQMQAQEKPAHRLQEDLSFTSLALPELEFGFTLPSGRAAAASTRQRMRPTRAAL